MEFKAKERAFEHSVGQYDEKYVSYLNGYKQSLQDIKAVEMLEFIKSIFEDYENGLIDDVEHLAIRAELLYNKATTI